MKKAAQLFEREAMQLEELGSHPQIPRLLAYFRQDRQQYLVQEFINGKTLAECLQEQGAFTEAQVREVLTGLLPVLEFVHAHRVIHRDIKPPNIIRTSGETLAGGRSPVAPQADGRLALVDFGAAKSTAGGALMQTGTAIGSPEYIAPEQHRGKAVYASDLFSLGVTCIHLLTQRSPFDLFDSSDDTWIWRRYLATPVSERLGQVLDRLLEPGVNRRYQSATEVLRDLGAVAGQKVQHPAVEILPLQVPTVPSTVISLPAQPPMGRSGAVAAVQAIAHAIAPPTSKPPVKRTAAGRSTTKASSSWQCVHQLLNPGKVHAIALSPTEPMLVSSSGTTIKLWDVQTGQPLRTLTGHLDVVYCLVISPDGKLLISGSADKSIRLWDLATGQRLGAIAIHTDTVLSLALSPDGRTLASGSLYDPIKLWNLEANREIASLSGQAGRIESLAFSPDGAQLASGSNDSSIALWDTRLENLVTGRELRLLKGHAQSVVALAFEPDGKTLGSGSWDGTVKLWSTRTQREKRTLQPESGRVTALAVSPNGKLLLTGSDTLKLWQPRNGKVIATLNGHTALVSAIAVSADNTTLVSSSWDGTIRIWQ